MSHFEAWLSNLEREVERLPVLHGDHAGVQAELRRLVAYARDRAGGPPALELDVPPATEPEPAAPERAAPPVREPATEPEPAPAPSDELPQ